VPIYEYHCQKCGKRVEKIQRFSDPPLKTHEGCGGKLDRMLSSPAIRFKGSGFYITDYARKSAPAEGSSSASSSESAAKGESGGAKAGGSEASGSKPASAESKKKKND